MIFSKKKPIKVYLDFDNTLVDSNSAMIYLLNQEYGTNKSYEELKKYDFKDLFPCLTDKHCEELFASSKLFSILEFFEDCYETLNYFKKRCEYSLVTYGTKDNLFFKEFWCKNKLPFIKDYFLLEFKGNECAYDKSMIDMSDGIFIDDHIDYLRSSNAKVKILFKNNHDGDWNKINNLDDVYVVNNWKEIYHIIKFYIENGGII